MDGILGGQNDPGYNIEYRVAVTKQYTHFRIETSITSFPPFYYRMMGNPSNCNEMAAQKTPVKNRAAAPNSPAIPSDMEDVPVSPIAASTDFGSTPTKSYAGFPRTPQGTSAAVLEAPSSRLRHSITMKKVAAGLVVDDGNAEANLSFDMGDVEMLTSADNLNQLAATPFSRTGQVNYVTLKEQEKVIGYNTNIPHTL